MLSTEAQADAGRRRGAERGRDRIVASNARAACKEDETKVGVDLLEPSRLPSRFQQARREPACTSSGTIAAAREASSSWLGIRGKSPPVMEHQTTNETCFSI